LDNALSEHGWKVFASHPAPMSHVWIDARIEFESFPDLPPPVLAVM
jgi:hypothetical protein